MTETESPFTLEVVKGVNIAKVTAIYLQEEQSRSVREHFEKTAKENQQSKFILDLENVRKINSQALGQLINLNKSMREKLAQWRIVNVHPDILEVLQITRLNKLFKILPDRALALESLEQ